MCGIFGIFGDGASESQRIERAKNSLVHRGPDAQQVVWLPGVCMGNTLLSIIGEQCVIQPIRSGDGRGILVFNGEIYNYLELLEELPELAKVCGRRERSDTVVLVEGLRLYGEAFLERLNGMFALAYHDATSGESLLVRDRLGIKPLFYSRVGGDIVFGSESRTVRILSDLPYDLDPEGFYSYLRFRYPLTTRTFDRNIRQVMPGNLVRITADGRLDERRWWSNRQAGGYTGSYDQAIERVEELVRSAIELRMRSDHDFSSFLSGGLDSSLIAAYASQNKAQLDTYSIGIPDGQEFDESKYSRIVGEKLETEHHPYVLKPDEFREQHSELIANLMEPLGVPNQVALKVLSREISKNHRVVLSGEGADEVFAGYGRIFLLPHDWELIVRHRDSGSEVTRKLVERFGQCLPSSYTDLFLQRYSYTPHDYAVELLRGWFPDINGDALRQSVEGDILEIFNAIDSDSPFNQMLVLFQNLHLPGLLSRVDSATMAHSVEARVPFLDHRVVEYVNTLPSEFKVRPLIPLSDLKSLVADEISERHDVPKAMLKDIGRSMLPPEIVDRRKMAFPIPASFYRTDGSTNLASYEAWTRCNLQLLASAIRN